MLQFWCKPLEMAAQEHGNCKRDSLAFCVLVELKASGLGCSYFGREILAFFVSRFLKKIGIYMHKKNMYNSLAHAL